MRTHLLSTCVICPVRRLFAAPARRLALLAVTAVMATAFFVPGQATAGPAPEFQLPFPCLHQVKAATYSGHGMAVDFWRAYAYDRSYGMPVLAAADGVVTAFSGDHGRPGGSDIYITLDHGNGWTTTYRHLQAGGVEPIVAMGAQVFQGQTIAHVGWTGSISPKSQSRSHLHLEVRENGAGRDFWAGGQHIRPAWGGGSNSSDGVYASANCPRFPDTLGNPHRDAVLHVADMGIVSGYSNGMYGAADPVTRGQLATFLVRALHLPAPTESAPQFADIGLSTHRDAIRSAAEAGAITGFPDGSFRPEDPVNRAQASTLLDKAFDIEDSDGEMPYWDVPSYSVHADAIVDLTDAAVVKGYPDHAFRPRDAINRAQFATLLLRAFNA